MIQEMELNGILKLYIRCSKWMGIGSSKYYCLYFQDKDMKKFFNRCKLNISVIIRIFLLKITFLIKMKFFRISFNRNIDFSMVTAYFLYFKMLETIDSIEVECC